MWSCILTEDTLELKDKQAGDSVIQFTVQAAWRNTNHFYLVLLFKGESVCVPFSTLLLCITQSSIAWIVPHQGCQPMLMFTLAITIFFLSINYNLKAENSVLRATLCRNYDYYSGGFVVAFALVKPTKEVKFSIFVVSHLGDAVMCLWSIKTVIWKRVILLHNRQ